MLDDRRNIQERHPNAAGHTHQMLGTFGSFLQEHTGHGLPLFVAQNVGYSYALVIIATTAKLMMGVVFAMGDRRAGHYLIYAFYPFRLLFYSNPWNVKNQGDVHMRSCEVDL